MATSSPAAAHVITVQAYNTIKLVNGTLYSLVTPFCGTYFFNILNLGPCTVYLRGDGDPAVNDPASETLPPGAADNLLPVADGVQGIRLIAGPPCTCEVLQELHPDPDFDPCKEPCPEHKEEHEVRIGKGATITVRLVQG